MSDVVRYAKSLWPDNPAHVFESDRVIKQLVEYIEKQPDYKILAEDLIATLEGVIAEMPEAWSLEQERIGNKAIVLPALNRYKKATEQK